MATAVMEINHTYGRTIGDEDPVEEAADSTLQTIQRSL